MRKISPHVLEEMLARPQVCARRFDGGCSGRNTMLWLCTYHHAVEEHTNSGGLDKEKNTWIALNMAEKDDLIKYSKAVDYVKMKETLNKKYGEYKM